MSNENSSGQGSQVSGVGQTANFGNHTSAGSGAAKVFREFKWGLLTLFLLMVVVIGLVYDGGRKKKTAELEKKPDDRVASIGLDALESSQPPMIPGEMGSLPPVNPPREAARAPRIDGYVPAPGLPAIPDPPVVVNPRTPGVPGVPDRTAETRTSVPPVPPPAAEKTYLVKPGDTLTGIASTVLPGKNGLKAILEANKDVLPNPNRLRVGMVLKIPSSSLVVAPGPVTPETATPRRAEGGAPNAQEGTEYIVQNGDTLERIARRLFNDGRKWRELYEWNRDQIPDPSRLRMGQVLKIKKDGHVSGAEKPSATGAAVVARADEKPAHVAAEPATAAQDVQVMSANSSAFAP